MDRNSDKDTIKVSTNFVTPISYVCLPFELWSLANMLTISIIITGGQAEGVYDYICWRLKLARPETGSRQRDQSAGRLASSEMRKMTSC